MIHKYKIWERVDENTGRLLGEIEATGFGEAQRIAAGKFPGADINRIQSGLMAVTFEKPGVLPMDFTELDQIDPNTGCKYNSCV